VRLGPTLRRLRSGRVGWLAVGVGLEAFSMFGDIEMFRECSAPAGRRSAGDALRTSEWPAPLDEAAGRGGVRHPGEITRNM
jgi:hypothetical protein